MSTARLLSGLAFLLVGLLFFHMVAHIDWLQHFECRHIHNPKCKYRRLGDFVTNLNRPETLKLNTDGGSMKIATLSTPDQLVIRDASPEEQYVVSKNRWEQMSQHLRNSVVAEWIKYKTLAEDASRLNGNSPPTQMDTAHAFYEFYLNDVLAALDKQEMALAYLDRVAPEYCGTVYTPANKDALFHGPDCACNDVTKSELKVSIGADLYLCAQALHHAPFITTQTTKSTKLTVPTAMHYDAPFARSLTRTRYNAAQKYALTPNLDGLVPIP
jgi:hypothetical protein